jgi:hypothetical protein
LQEEGQKISINDKKVTLFQFVEENMEFTY